MRIALVLVPVRYRYSSTSTSAMGDVFVGHLGGKPPLSCMKSLPMALVLVLYSASYLHMVSFFCEDPYYRRNLHAHLQV